LGKKIDPEALMLRRFDESLPMGFRKIRRGQCLPKNTQETKAFALEDVD
jgi:hypothetical protein